MAKRYIVLAICVTLVLVAVQTPDVHANKLPPGFVDRTHIYFGHGWEGLAASSSNVTCYVIPLVPIPGILNAISITIFIERERPKSPQVESISSSVQSSTLRGQNKNEIRGIKNRFRNGGRYR
jgi:hypothetical protein